MEVLLAKHANKKVLVEVFLHRIKEGIASTVKKNIITKNVK
jgi:hypothetical protein